MKSGARRILKIEFLIPLFVLFIASCGRENTFSASTAPKTPAEWLISSQREYLLRQRLELKNHGPRKPEKQNLWIALISTFPPYQEVRSMDIFPGRYSLIVDELGNRYAEFDFSDHPADEIITVQIEYRVVVNELTYDLSSCIGDLPSEFIQPELHIESANPQIISLTAELSHREADACQKARAFYDFIGDELVYSFNRRNWGAQAALGEMGADCTEYASLMVALSRAAGIPARYFEGLLYLGQENKDLARLEHAWADVFLPGVGWVAVDPTLGRSSIYRDNYFAHYTADHFIITMGASPSTLRGSSYYTHLYWPGNSTEIQIAADQWMIELVEERES